MQPITRVEPRPEPSAFTRADMTWETVRREMLMEMARWVLNVRPTAGVVDPARDRVWAVYSCVGCGQRRAGFCNVLKSEHVACRPHGEVICIGDGLTYREARLHHTSPDPPPWRRRNR